MRKVLRYTLTQNDKGERDRATKGESGAAGEDAAAVVLAVQRVFF